MKTATWKLKHSHISKVKAEKQKQTKTTTKNPMTLVSSLLWSLVPCVWSTVELLQRTAAASKTPHLNVIALVCVSVEFQQRHTLENCEKNNTLAVTQLQYFTALQGTNKWKVKKGEISALINDYTLIWGCWKMKKQKTKFVSSWAL